MNVRGFKLNDLNYQLKVLIMPSDIIAIIDENDTTKKQITEKKLLDKIKECLKEIYK